MKLRVVIPILSLLGLSFIATAQKGSPWSKIDYDNYQKKKIYKGGLAIQKEFFGEFGIGFCKRLKKTYAQLPMYKGWITSFEFNLTGIQQLYALKFGHEWNLAFVGARISGGYYTTFKDGGDFRICPEVGISLLSYVSVYYGFNIRPFPNYYNDLGKHRLGIYANIF